MTSDYWQASSSCPGWKCCHSKTSSVTTEANATHCSADMKLSRAVVCWLHWCLEMSTALSTAHNLKVLHRTKVFHKHVARWTLPGWLLLSRASRDSNTHADFVHWLNLATYMVIAGVIPGRVHIYTPHHVFNGSTDLGLELVSRMPSRWYSILLVENSSVQWWQYSMITVFMKLINDSSRWMSLNTIM